MFMKEFSLVVFILCSVGFAASKKHRALENVTLPDNFMGKYMQQSIKNDLERINLFDRLASSPPRQRSSSRSKNASPKSALNKLKKRRGATGSRKLEDLENIYSSILSPDYNSGIVNNSFGVSDDNSSRNVIS